MMRLLPILVLVVTFAVTTATSVAQAKTVVVCDNDPIAQKVKPKTCNFPVFPVGGDAVASDAGHFYVGKMKHWRHWGSGKASVRGTLFGNMDTRSKVKVTLSFRRKCGDNFVYFHVRFSGIEGLYSIGDC